MTYDLAQDLDLAHDIADALDELTRDRFGSLDLNVTAKPDSTPVSDADLEAERIARALIGAKRATDEILGEEFGGVPSTSGRQWVIDPIDGTKNFVRGVPVWASLIALMIDGVPVVGVVSAPALKRRWWGSTGGGAWLQDDLGDIRRLEVSGVSDLSDASLSFSSLSGWEDRDLLPALVELTHVCWRTRAYGDFWSYMLVAEGAVDVACEPELALHDMAALIPIVREAGGTFTSLEGVPGPAGGSAIATNSLLHAAALKVLGTADHDGADGSQA